MIKKVLFVCSIYKPNIGGIETTIEELCRNLNKNGIETTVLTKLFPFDLPIFDKFEDTKIVRIKRPQSESEYLESINFLSNHKNLIKSDIIHIVGVRRPMPLYALLLARYWKVPCVVTFAGGDIPDPNEPESIEIWEEGLKVVPQAIKQSDFLTTFSKYTGNLAKKNISDLGEIKTVYAGIDLDRINKVKHNKEKFKYYFAARRLDPSKGIDLLIKAYDSIKPQIGNTKLIIAGDGVEKENLEKLVKGLKLEGDVIFLGEVDHSTVISYMKGALAHVCPSRTEGGGIVNYEAQASGCLAIGSDTGGIPEYIQNGETGLLFPRESVAELAKLLLQVCEDTDFRNRIMNIAYKEVRTKTWEEFSKQYLNLYNSLTLHYKPRDFRPWSGLTKKMWSKLKNGQKLSFQN